MLIKEKGKIISPYIISEFLHHSSLKKELINLIEETKIAKSLTTKVNTVSKCDYDWSKDTTRLYFKKLIDPLGDHLTKVFKHLGYNICEIKNLWFQRYLNNDIHDWHNHGDCQWTGVYYLELPKEETLKTQILQPFDHKSRIDMNVVEGNILIFPSHTLHRGQRNITNKKKIIISFNMDGVTTEAQYPENYKTIKDMNYGK